MKDSLKPKTCSVPCRKSLPQPIQPYTSQKGWGKRLVRGTAMLAAISGIFMGKCFGVDYTIDDGLDWYVAGSTTLSNLTVGQSHTGFLTFNIGGIVWSTSYGYIGADTTGVGVVNISASEWASSDGLYVGYSGMGTLNLSGSGVVTVAAGSGTLTLAANAGSVGTLNIGGTSGNTGGTLNAATVYGGAGTATVNFNQTDAYTFASSLTGSMNMNQIGSGTTVLTGSSNISGTATANAGALIIQGGSLTDTTGVIGSAAGTSGTVSVLSGTWRSSGDTVVGGSGNGTLNISGGYVSSSRGFVGYSVGSTGSVAITGGTWNNNTLRVGFSGTGQLALSGGYISSYYGYIGDGASGTGMVTVTGGTWAHRYNLTIGNSGDGSLALSAGLISSAKGFIGFNNGSVGSATVTGGTWTNNNALYVGYSGTGTLNLSGSGVITVASGNGTLTLAANAGSEGTLNLGGASGSDTAGTLNVATIYGGAGTATVNFNLSTTQTYRQAFTGSLGMNLLGTGLIILTGNNTYSGLTTINSGMLQIGNGGTSGALGSGDVLNNSALVFDRADTLVYSGAISGSGNLIQNGTGTLILSGNNTYTGLTVLNSGTLQIGTGGTTGSIGSGDVLNNAVLVFDRSDAVNYAGAISGSGSLVQNGTGTLILSGNNTYTGLTAINSGTLQIGNGGTSGTIGSGDVLNNAVLVFNRSDAVTYAGTISGIGSLVQSGSGELILTGNSTYTGATTVESGTLAVNGSIASNVTVLGGVLGGSGIIGGSVYSTGNVSPGNSPGTLTISGNYTQAASGTLTIQIASTSMYDRLVVGGTATLDGALAISLDGYTFKKGDSFEFLTASAISGSFASITGTGLSNGTLLSLALSSGTGNLTLFVSQGLFSGVSGLTPNERAVAKALDKVVNRSSVTDLVTYLDGIQTSRLPGYLDRLAPTDLIPMFDAVIAADQVQAFNLERRMTEIQNGATGFSASGLSVTDSHGTRNFSGASDGKQLVDKNGKDLAPAPLGDRWGFFINGSGEYVDEQSTATVHGTDFETGGITAGADYRLGDHAAFGLAAGYANTTGNGRNDNAVKIDSGKLAAYATVFNGGFFVNSAVGGGINSYNTRRDILGGTARGDTDGTDLNALLGTGYTYRHGGFSAGPIGSLRYTCTGIDGFTERGSLAPLRIGDQSEASLKSALGAQASYTFQLGKKTLTPQVRAQWLHEYLDATRSIGASFLPGGAFTVNGPDLGRDSLLLDAGMTFQLTPFMSLYGFYTGDLGRANYTSHSINGGVQVSF